VRRAAAAVAALALLGAGAVGCGDDDDGAARTAAQDARLEWVGTPLVFAPDGRPGDRVLAGKVRNTGAAPVELRADEVLTVDADGRRRPANGRFAEAFGHGLYGPGGPPAPYEASRYDQRRLGEIVTLAPGATKPITMAWRGRAQELQVGRWRLDLPPVSKPAGR
jgi:hypothetical protein